MGTSYTFNVDKNVFADNESVEVLKKAAEELFTATEADFEQLKSQQWYQQIWKMVTFSKNEVKVVAKNITSLAKAQDIVLKLLLSLSEDNREIARVVSQLSDRLYNLANSTEKITQRVVDVDNFVKYGYKKSGSIADFSDAQKSVLLSALNHIADAHSYTENLDVFLLAIRRMAGYQERNTDFNINNFIFDDKKSLVIFPLLLEMNYICTGEYELCDEISEVIDHLSISSANQKKIKAQVEADIQRVGINGVIALYSAMAPELFIDDSDIEFEEDWYESLAQDELYPPELAEVTITNIIHIANDEVRAFSHQVIHLDSYIVCAGTLMLENCLIHYHDKPGSPCQITLQSGSSLEIRNCKFICENIDNTPLFKDEGSTSITITDSIFEDCSYFIDKTSGGEGTFVLQGCEIINPYIHFLNMCGVSEGVIRNCQITYTKPLPGQADVFSGNVFQVSPWGRSSSVEVNEVIVNGNAFFSDEEDPQDFSLFHSQITLFDMKNANYTNCTFENMSHCISDAGNLSHCKFSDCMDVIKIGFHIDKCGINHCTFTGCESIISGNNMKIAYCQFVKCSNSLIKSSVVGNVRVEFCEFYNIKQNKTDFFSPACLCFHRSKGDQYGSSSVKNCIFNGIEIENGFLIAGQASENIKGKAVYIEGCSFRNCTTERESGKIIKCYDTYFNLFKKQIEIEVTSISDCLGLDKVNHENGYVEDVIVRAKDNTGGIIGATALGFTMGGIFGAIGGASSMIIKDKLINDTDVHVE